MATSGAKRRVKVSLKEEIGRNGEIALALFLRSCLFEPQLGLGPVRRALREFLDSGNSLNSFENLRLRISPSARQAAEREREEGLRQGYSLLSFASAEYPVELLDLPEPPATLWCWGRIPDLHKVALVGSRACSPESEKFARTLAYRLTLAKTCVVSGLARGIDSAAHRGACLAADGGEDQGRSAGIGVLGSGLTHFYPRENRSLARDLVEAGGCVLSEYRLEQNPHPLLFPDRNRVLSALAHAVVVVEAGERSGSLITARLASELGRDIFTVPGSVQSASCRGSNELIRLGARILLSPDEIREVLPMALWRGLEEEEKGRKQKTKMKHQLDFLESAEERELAQKLLRLCEVEEREVESLHRNLFVPPETIMALLSRLELRGLLVRGRDGGWLSALREDPSSGLPGLPESAVFGSHAEIARTLSSEDKNSE